jgi:hypothetical protein
MTWYFDFPRHARLAAWLAAEWAQVADARVASGEVAAETSVARLETLYAIAADWRFVVTLAGATGHEVSAEAKRKELSRIARVWRAIADHYPDDPRNAAIADGVEILLWHQQRPWPNHVDCAEMTIRLRERAAADARARALAPAAEPGVIALPAAIRGRGSLL